MYTSLFLRCLLLLLLLLNGLVAAHAAVPLPVPAAASMVAALMDHDMAHEGCHDSGEMSAADEPAPKAPHAECCKGAACQCACATQAPAAGARLLFSPAPAAPVQAALPAAYRSVDLALILRPPIA